MITFLIGLVCGIILVVIIQNSNIFREYVLKEKVKNIYLKSGQIEAIKYYKNKTGKCLYSSKKIVDKYTNHKPKYTV